MKNLEVCISKSPRTDGVVCCRTVSVRERVLRRLLGPPCRVTVLIPGDSVGSISITNLREGGCTV